MDIVDVLLFWLAILLTPIPGALRKTLEYSHEAGLIKLEKYEAVASEDSCWPHPC